MKRDVNFIAARQQKAGANSFWLPLFDVAVLVLRPGRRDCCRAARGAPTAAAKTHDVQNLVITVVTTSAGNPDYFKFDPEAPEGSPFLKPTVTFTIADGGDSHRYKWRVRVRSTDVDNTWADFVLISGAADGPGTVMLERVMHLQVSKSMI